MCPLCNEIDFTYLHYFRSWNFLKIQQLSWDSIKSWELAALCLGQEVMNGNAFTQNSRDRYNTITKVWIYTRLCLNMLSEKKKKSLMTRRGKSYQVCNTSLSTNTLYFSVSWSYAEATGQNWLQEYFLLYLRFLQCLAFFCENTDSERGSLGDNRITAQTLWLLY